MKYIYILLIVIAVIVLFYYCINQQQEHLEDSSTTVYTNPKPGEELRDPMHLSSTVYRVTNTILTAANMFSDKMDTLPLPDNIKDAYNEWIEKGFVSPVKDQMLCGGCWAFATCACLADRIAVATNGRWYAPFGLSEQVLISCGGEMGMDFYQGCAGGIPQYAIDALVKDGVPDDSICVHCGGGPSDVLPEEGSDTKRTGGVVNPNNLNTCKTGGNYYAATDYTWWQTGCDENTSCGITAASTCPCQAVRDNMKSVGAKLNSPEIIKYKTIGSAHTYTSHSKNNEIHTVDLWPDIPQDIIAANVERMKKAIYYEGPITIGYRVNSDFYTFWPTSSVDNYYKYDGKSPMAGGHAVIIVGWKKMADGTPVWIIKNSWGANGGYGFPNGPKVVDPVSGKSEIKYKGGFWNHIMGINDSFVESNATGAHPDLSLPQISKYFPNNGKDIPKEWYKTMTLRDVQQLVISGPAPSPSPVKPPAPSPSPVKPPVQEEVPTPITSSKFATFTLAPEDITLKSLEEFFLDPNNLYMVGANHNDTIVQILKYLPDHSLSENDMNTLVEKMSANIDGYVIVAAKGDANNYYIMAGSPIDWGVLNRNFVQRAGTLKKFVNEMYAKFLGLHVNAPVVQVIHKNEGFYYHYIH